MNPLVSGGVRLAAKSTAAPKGRVATGMAVPALGRQLCGGVTRGHRRAPDRGGASGARRGGREGLGGVTGDALKHTT